MKISEFELIRKIRARVPAGLKEKGLLRDDAAELKSVSGPMLMTADTLVEGVDFIRSRVTPEQVGQKALGVNLSDIAAMGGVPLYFTVALGIPPGMTSDWFERFYSGMMKWARAFHVICAGGDISSAKELFISITVLGRFEHGRMIPRSGGKAGDRIGVTGCLGGSILGRHLNFKPRIQEGCFLNKQGVRSMIDISDGFLQDLGHLLKESGVGANLDVSKIPVSRNAFKKAGGNRTMALEYALSDGEDFELLFTIEPKKADILTRKWKAKFPHVPLTWVGTLTEQKDRLNWFMNGKITESPSCRKQGFSHSL